MTHMRVFPDGPAAISTSCRLRPGICLRHALVGPFDFVPASFLDKKVRVCTLLFGFRSRMDEKARSCALLHCRGTGASPTRLRFGTYQLGKRESCTSTYTLAPFRDAARRRIPVLFCPDPASKLTRGSTIVLFRPSSQASSGRQRVGVDRGRGKTLHRARCYEGYEETLHRARFACRKPDLGPLTSVNYRLRCGKTGLGTSGVRHAVGFRARLSRSRMQNPR